MLQEINQTDYRKTMTNGVTDVTETVEPSTDVWLYVEHLVANFIAPSYVLEQKMVEKVYRTNDKKYDHVVLPTEKEDHFIVLIVDLNDAVVRGHHLLKLDELYR